LQVVEAQEWRPCGDRFVCTAVSSTTATVRAGISKGRL
jgi:hypothetical protein